ncbi:hypothetical protein M514_05811 [Trichuris suis]|nr:hypothetical protein M514_05811 [Trichuris suis]
MLENYYNTYTSCRYSRRRRKWFVALNKRGRPRRGNRSRNKQKYAQFLVLHLDDEDVKGQQKRFFTNSPFGLDSFTQKWRSQKFQHSYQGRHWRQVKLKRGIDLRHEFRRPLVTTLAFHFTAARPFNRSEIVYASSAMAGGMLR